MKKLLGPVDSSIGCDKVRRALNINIINKLVLIYAPTAHQEDIELEELYEEVNQILHFNLIHLEKKPECN